MRQIRLYNLFHAVRGMHGEKVDGHIKDGIRPAVSSPILDILLANKGELEWAIHNVMSEIYVKSGRKKTR